MNVIERADAFRLRYRLDTAVGGSGVSVVDVVIVEVSDAAGASGLGFTYVIGGRWGEVVLAAARIMLQEHVVGRVMPPPPALWRDVVRGFNRTGEGPSLLALAALDVAAWDLHARRHGVPLGVAMGGTLRPVPVYGSGGFTASQSGSAAADTALGHVANRLRAVKVRVSGQPSDAALLASVRRALPEQIHLMVDANEKCDLAAARWLLSAARDVGALYVEEPVAASHVDAYRSLARSGGASLAAGEHLQSRGAFLPFLSERLLAVVQPDLAMAGGLTPILQIVADADAFGISAAPHFLPGLFVHLAAAAANVSWLEHFPLLEPLFDGWPGLEGGMMAARSVPGHGLTLAPDARARYGLDA